MTPPLRVLLVDDEAPARALLREYLDAEEGLEVIAECPNGFEAVKAVTLLSPDLVFLDIQMPKLNGFEVLELLSPAPPVVFCTAHDEYALRAFEAHAVDYLLKPVGRERFREALARVRARLGRGAEPAPEAARALAAAARPAGTFAGRILVRDGVHVQIIPAAQIDFLEAQDDYVAIHAGDKTWLKTTTLSGLAADLDPERFIQIHRSCVLNIDRLARVELVGKDSRVAILKDGRELPMSRSGYARLRERF